MCTENRCQATFSPRNEEHPSASTSGFGVASSPRAYVYEPTKILTQEPALALLHPTLDNINAEAEAWRVSHPQQTGSAYRQNWNLVADP